MSVPSPTQCSLARVVPRVPEAPPPGRRDLEAAAVEGSLDLYRRRAALGLGLFDGRPAPAPRPLEDLAAELEEVARAQA